MAGARLGERCAVGGVEVDRRDGGGLGDDAGDPQGLEPRPPRLLPVLPVPRARARPARFLSGPLGSGEFAERLLPTGAERRDVQGFVQEGRVAVGEVEECVGVGDAEFLGALADEGDLVADLDVSLGEDAQVEAGAVVGDQQGGHGGFAQAHTDAVAGDARLGDFEFRLADAVPVADAHFVVGQPVDGEILPEAPERQVIAAELLPPVPVGLQLVDEYGTDVTAMTGQVSLAVSVDIQPSHHPRAVHGGFPGSGVDGPALPGHILRHADVHGQQRRHRGPPAGWPNGDNPSWRGDLCAAADPSFAPVPPRFRDRPPWRCAPARQGGCRRCHSAAASRVR